MHDKKANGDDIATYLARSSSGVDDGNFAPPSSIHRSDSRNNSKLLLAKDKLIESLRLELAEAQIKLVESENQGGGRLREVERQLMEARMANARLMEDNESYQLLLQEKTLNGDFGKSDFSYMSSARREQRSSGGSQTGATNTSGPAANQDALNALEGRGASQTSLADELSAVGDDAEPGSPGQEGTAQSEESSRIRKLEAELRSMKDQNKALTLYINKIIERLLQHDNFEHILDQNDGGPRQRAAAPNTDKELPPPPPKQQPAATGPSLLQRAKSIAISATAAASKPRPRPASVVQPPPQPQPGGFADPETAPSIPIGLARTQSLLGGIGRRGPGGRPMSEQFTGAGGVGGAGVVHQMYRGGAADPTSPTARAQNFFAPGGSGARAPSQGHSPLAARPSSATDGEAGAGRGGNFPGSMHSETSSTSESDDVATGGAPSPPNQASPPRPSAASIHTAGSGSPEHPLGQGKSSTMFVGGNKPRPLRLVQENDTSAANAAAQNKRASWIGWAWNATVAGGHGQGQDTVKN